jgi:hypothetical protein
LLLATKLARGRDVGFGGEWPARAFLTKGEGVAANRHGCPVV